MKVAEAFLAGLIGFLIGRGVEPQDATSIVEALRSYLGFEPPLGLTGYALEDIQAGKEANSAVVVRGKAYDVVAVYATTLILQLIPLKEPKRVGKQNV